MEDMCDMREAAAIRVNDCRTISEHWLFDYAHAVGASMSLEGHRIKGLNHEPRREIDRTDIYLRTLPPAFIHPLQKDAHDPNHRRRAKKPKKIFDRVRVVLEEHYHLLHDALLACGYDLDRNRVLSSEACGAARLWWEMNHTPMPEEMAARLRELSLQASRREDARLFRKLQS